LLLQEYCKENKIFIIRIPYFIQLNNYSIPLLFSENIVQKYQLENKIKTKYKNGFWDKKIVYPADFNSFGWTLFWKLYKNYINKDFSLISKEIFESLKTILPEIALGINYIKNEEKKIFIENYPT
jgi:hypothetical protein